MGGTKIVGKMHKRSKIEELEGRSSDRSGELHSSGNEGSGKVKKQKRPRNEVKDSTANVDDVSSSPLSKKTKGKHETTVEDEGQTAEKSAEKRSSKVKSKTQHASKVSGSRKVGSVDSPVDHEESLA